jgi:hypothetical protein
MTLHKTLVESVPLQRFARFPYSYYQQQRIKQNKVTLLSVKKLR